MTEEGFLLSPQNARDYLVEQGFMRGEEEVSVRALGGAFPISCCWWNGRSLRSRVG